MTVATTLKLREALKARIAALAQSAGKTPHAWMIEALEAQAELAERRRTFVDEALASVDEVDADGVLYAMEDVHAYIAERAAGGKPPRPRATSGAPSSSAPPTARNDGGDMPAVRFSRRALNDPDRIFDFLASVDPAAARRAGSAIIESTRLLERHPMMGRAVHGVLRELAISYGRDGYDAMYHHLPRANRIDVLAIRHQREAGYG